MVGHETIGSILKQKGNEVFSVAPSATVFDAISIMAEKHIAAVLVMGDGRLQGVVSVKDYGRDVVLKDRSSKAVRVDEIMTSPVITIAQDQTVGSGLAVMTHEGIRHLPVLADGSVVGVVSMGDLARSLVSEQAFTIDELHKYVGRE